MDWSAARRAETAAFMSERRLVSDWKRNWVVLIVTRIMRAVG